MCFYLFCGEGGYTEICLAVVIYYACVLLLLLSVKDKNIYTQWNTAGIS